MVFSEDFNLHGIEGNLKIDRPAYSQENLHEVSNYAKPRVNKVKQFFKDKAAGCRPWRILKQIFPILTWLPQYDFKRDLSCDIIAGCTVAVMHIPQGLGYALLANVPAVVGIYMAFFPNLVYVLLGTSRHNSMGTFAVITILVGRSVVTYSKNPLYTHAVYAQVNGTAVLTNVMYTELEVGTSVTLIVSFWHFLMYFCRMGVICTLLSDALVNAFICGAGFHIFTSQIKEVFGVKPGRYVGPLQLIYTYIDIFTKLSELTPKTRITTYAALIISAVCIGLLVLNLYIFKPWLEKKTSIPFPLELILVVAGVFASTGLGLKENYGVVPIGYIQKGIPGPSFPYLNLFSELLMNSFVTAIVAYAVSMSMGLILAEGQDYEVDPNQEFLAHAVGNFFGSIFSCIVYGASLSRSMVLRGVGGKTQLTALTAAGIIVIILLWIADFFQPLPRAVLASIIIVALKKILIQVLDFPKFWRLSKLDGLVWLCVFISVIVIDIDYGLGIGFLLSVGVIFIQGLKAYTCLLGNISGTDLYLDITRYRAASQIPGIKIIHYRGSLNFATRQHLKLEVIRLTDIDPARELKRKKKLEKKLEKKALKDSKHENMDIPDGVTNLAFVGTQTDLELTKKTNCIILDFSALSAVDPSGAARINKIYHEYKSIGIMIMVAGCPGPIYERIKKCGYLTGDESLLLFPTIHDAVHYAKAEIDQLAIQDTKSDDPSHLGAPAL